MIHVSIGELSCIVGGQLFMTITSLMTNTMQMVGCPECLCVCVCVCMCLCVCVCVCV